MSSEVAAIGTNANLPLDADAEHVELQRRADCRSPFDPYALTKYGLLDAASASKLYMDECQAAGLHINSTFVKQVQSGTTVFEFDNGYLGEHGIIPIMKTLRQLPIEALLLPKCELEADDIQLICETFTIHPSLQRMDLRGNLITLSSAKLLMTLVVRNTSITEVLMNPLSPKYVQIQRQCCLNANVIMNAGNCLSCNHPMTHTPTKQIESTLITVLLENFRANEDHVSVIEVEAIFRIILSLCAKSHGVLFLCSETCVEHIAGHIYACVRGVIKTCNLKVPFELPKHPQLRAATEKLIKEISGRKLPASAFSGVYSILSDEDALEKYFDENLDRKCTERCSVCGSLGTSVLPNGGAVLLLQLREDLKKGAPLNPTAVVRLCKVMIQHATVRPCSRKCTRQLIRYALYGYGGITRSLSVDEPLLTTTGVNLDGLPAGDFALINYTKAVVDRLDDEEISCALSVASLMEDIEGIPIDPYMIFAMGRHLQEVPSSAIGMQLQCACEAVRLVGCLPASEAPFHRREGDRPLRESYAHWGDWAKLGDVERLLHIAFARRRMGAYAVDGPHGNNFDNVRAALWAFREQKRCAVVVMKVSLRWLNLPGGVIPESVTPRGGFYTTVKVVGQTTIDNNQHLIIQGNFGTQAGKNGFFYIPKSIFNRYAPGLPYMFVDVAMFRDTMNPLQLGTASTFAMKHVQPVVLDSARHQQQAFHALQNLLMAVSSTQPVPRSIMHRLSAILHRVPPAFFFAFQKNWSGASRTQLRWIKYVLRLIRGVRMHSQLLFCANEIMSTKVSEWIEDVLSRQHFPSPARVALSRCAASPQSSQHAITHRKPHADLRWTSVEIMADHFPDHPAPPPPPEPVVPEVVAEPEPVPANPKQRPPIGKRGGAAAPAPPAAPAKPPSAHKKRRPKRISDDLGDPARANLEQYWTIERQRTIAKESLGRTNGGDQMLSGAALFRAMAATKSPARSSSVSDPLGRSYLHPSFADLKDSLHPRLLGRPWQVMHIVEENESLSEFVALFIDDCISIYDCQKQLVVCDVAPVKKNEIFAHLPFSSGFDCLFHNPRAPREVYFISGGHWIVWDAYTQQTLAGPYGLDAHDKFKKLPAPFLDHIDAAVAVPSTPYVLFFTQLCYVVFDMETSLPVCPPFFLRPPDEELLRRQKREKDDPLMELKREKRKHHARDEAPPPVPPRLPEGAPSFSPTLQVSLPHGPMAAMWPMTQAEGKRVVLIGSDGTLITTDLCAPDDLTMTVVNPIMHSTLANTPLEYRQMTTDALPSVISSLCIRHFSEPFNPEIRQVHLLEVEGSSHLVSRSNSNSTGSLAQHGGGLIMGNEPATVVDATFIKTTLAEELPLSISRVTSARQGCALLSQEVFFSEGRNAALRSHAASDEVPHSVEFDLGDDRAESLGAVILVLNTARIHREILQLAPLRVTVESSDDRIAYRPHGSFLAEGTFTPSCWAKSHAARYWRLRFHTQLPPGVGITRIFWYRAEWILATGALSVLEPYSPAVNTVVMDVQAARLWRPASSLVEPLGTSPVFALAGREGWRQKHAILPLLGEARSCLFFCGNGFVEYDMNQFEVVSSRSLSLLQHPAFIELPTPFNLGFDAIFYPDFETSPDTVVIVRDGLCVWWSLQEGSLSDRVKRCDETLFRGIPINMDVVVDIVNAWDAPGEVWVMYRSENLQMHALRWHVEHHRIIAGPSEWSEFPNLYSPEVKPEHEVLCMTSCPFNPSTFYIFFDESVVSSITSGSRKISLDKHTMAPPLAKLSREFYRMTLYLNMWGKRLQYCTITVDLREHMRQLLGMELRSSRGDQTTWSVEYSDDGREWKRVTQHIQRDSLSVTTWKPSMVKNCSHRYWRFHTEGLQHIGHADLDEEPSVYSQLRFLILPLQLHRELPSRAVFSGTLNGTVGSWLRREGATLAFESRMMEGSKDASAADLEEAHFISLDYGHSPVELSGFSCRCTTSTSGRSNDLWTIFCSDDGEDWKQCGSWRSFFSIACAHWFIGRPYRFWRIELRAKQSCPVFDHFHFYRYDGPSIVLLDRGEGSLMTPGTQLLWQSDALHVENSLEASQVGMHFRTHLGNTITLDTKSATAPIVGLELHALACSSPKVEFVVECSDDGARWTGVGTLIFYAEGHRRALSTWDITDSHRFWRLRLTYSAIPAASMRLESVQARVAKSDLYVTYLSAPSAEPEMVHLHLPVQRNVVRVKAVLPPLSEYVVEKLALDCIGWEFVATLVNVEESERTIVKGWMTGVPSASWRMRYQGRPGSASLSPLERDLSLGGDGGALMLPPPPPISVPVRWYAFSAMRVLPVPINTVLDVDVSIERFEELAPAMDLLTSNDPSHPILQFTSPSIPTPVPEEVEPSPPKEVKKDSRDSKRSPGGRSKSMESVGRVGRPRSKSRDRAEVESSVAGEDAEVGPPAPPPPPPDPSVTWSFPSPAHFCRVNLVSELVLAMPLGDTLTAASVESTDVSQSLEPIEGDGIAVPAIEPPPPMAIVVETSDNGRDFVPIAESIYESERVGLSWIATERALYWRLRLRHMPPEATISISAVRWFASVGTAAALQPAPTSTVTNTAYATWVREAFNYEEYFCKQCRLGFDQAKSKDSKLREPDDIDPWGLTAETIWKLKKKYQAFISKIAKDTARGTEPPEGPYFSPDRGLATDVMYYFLRSADKFDSNIADLIELIANPINFSKAMTYCKADSHWFYPHFEVRGELADDFHSFAQANASFGVYWSLSLPLQRNLNALEQPTPMSPLSPHIASPMFTVSITKTGWRASDAFPHLPFLYHAGFSGRPMTMVFTLNDMHFTPAYNLQIPGSKPLPIDFPFTVGAGVNFLHHGYLAQCPAPVFDRLRYIYTPKFLDEYRTVIVLTTLSLRSKSAKVRFSLPAHGMDFGIPGLEIDCLQFEVTMAARPPPASASGEVEEEASTPRYMDCDYEINFVSHGARYRASTKDNDHDAPRWIPFSIMGSFDRAGTPSFTLSGRSPSGSVAMATLPGVKLTDIHFSALVMTGDTPQSFQRPRVKVEATLLLPFGLAVRCHYTLLASNCLFGEMEDGLYLHTLGVSLGDFLLLIQWFQGVVVRSSVDALPQLKPQTWTELLPITLSMQLRISVAQQDLHGTGMMRIYDRTATDVTVFANCDGVSLSASVPRLKVGEIELESSPTDRPVYVYVGTSVKSLSKGEKSRLASGVSVHLDGYCALLSSTPLPAKLQLTKAGSLLVCTGRTMDVCVEDMGYSPSGSWGQVAIRADVFIRLLVEHLKDAPIVQSLMAHGVPFSLSSPEVTSSVCSIRQRRLVLTAKGVFFGSYFSVSTVVDDPEDTVVQVEDSTSGLALRIVEQCEEALWSSYSNVVGCRTSSDSAAPIPLMDEDDAESQKALQHHFATKEGAFLSRWIHREVQAFDSTMRAIGFE